jgi:sodium-dependent dicarboxylate transporter 2/3/5
MIIGVPLAVIMLIIAWVYLTKFAFRLDENEMHLDYTMMDDELAKMGKMTRPEFKVLIVFFAVALGWILRGFLFKDLLPDISDATVAVAGAIILFVIPAGSGHSGFLLDWRSAVKIPWDVILLFGGGLALAKGFHSTGLDIWIGTILGNLGHLHIFVLVLIVGISTMLLTELTSNTATAAMLIPIIAGAAIADGMHPYGPIVAVTISSSYAFMLPVATPPNAIVFGSHQLTIAKMAKTGAVLNIIGLIIIAFLITFILGSAWEFDLYQLPVWLGN